MKIITTFLLCFLSFFNTIFGQQILPQRDFKNRFTQGVSVGVSKSKLLYELYPRFDPDMRPITAKIDNIYQINWHFAYNMEYKINKKFSLRSYFDISKFNNSVTVSESGGDIRYFQFGSFDIGVPLQILYKVGTKRFRPVVFMGIKTHFLTETGKDRQFVNITSNESGVEAGFGAEYHFSKYLIRQELSLYNGLTFWLNEDYFYPSKTFYSMSRDFLTLRLVVMQRK